MNLCKRLVTAGSMSLACALLAVTLAAPVAGAHARVATHARMTKITGVVRSINIAHHTITVAATVPSRRGHRTKLMTLDVSSARVTGHHGSFAIGDKVSITATGVNGSCAGTATTIAVIGVANGGSNGNGAAIAGTVTTVDESAGMLTLAAPRPRGAAATQSIAVEVTSSTILAVQDAGGSAVSLSDIDTGDHVIVVTADVTAKPIVALGVIDSSHPGSNHSDPTLPAPAPATHQSVTGVVAGVDLTAGSLAVTDQAGDAVTVMVGGQTPVYALSGDTGQASALGDVNVGDAVRVRYTGDLSSTITANVVYDLGPARTPPIDPPTPPAPPAPPSPTPPSPAPPTGNESVSGVVASIDEADSQLVITGTEVAENITVMVADTTSVYEISDGGAEGQTATLADVKVGDTVKVRFTGALSSTITATVLYDTGTWIPPAPPSPPTPPPPPTLPQTGSVTATVTGVYPKDDAITVTAGGIEIAVVYNDETVYSDSAPGASEPATIADINVGDSLSVTWISASAHYVVASEIDDGGPAKS